MGMVPHRVVWDTWCGLYKVWAPSPHELAFGVEFYLSSLQNPSVRKHKTLVSSCFEKVCVDWSKYPVIGFGFHQPTNDYRVVRIIYQADYYFNFLGQKAPKIEVFSLKRNTWRTVRNAAVPQVADREDWAFINGSIYWLEAKRPNEYPESMWILSFDLNDEVFGEVKCPDNFQDWVGREPNVSLMEFKDSVSICVFSQAGSQSQKFCIWVMRHEGGAVSWTKHFNFELEDKIGWPLKLTRNGKLIIMPVGEDYVLNDLVSCDLKSLELKDLGNAGPSTVDTAFVESLVLLGEGNALSRHRK